MQSFLESTSLFVKRKMLPALLFLSVAVSSDAYADVAFEDKPLKEVLHQLQDETPYFFLYRESLIADIRVTLFSSEEKMLDDLKSVLREHDISLLMDSERNQVFLTRTQKQNSTDRAVTLKGQVVDMDTGERLPFATLSWEEDGLKTGATTNGSGYFEIRRSPDDPEWIITVSYMGFKKREVRLNTSHSDQFTDLTIRLEPEVIKGSDIVITGFAGYHPSDTLLSGMIDARRFSPLGESNSIRALQAHPSVSMGSAMNDGINVRGSSPDGFRVILDGMSIFNQSHLFGLLDSFNEDAIQSSGYYFGVVPANIDTPTGGTLNLITRTGSRNEFKTRAGISNTSISSTFEGPLGDRSSWLLSTRLSYMDQIDWFNNMELIKWGLDIDRPRRVASEDPDFTDFVLQPGASSAHFIDIHGKIYHETSESHRFIVSGYFGGDRTRQNARRRTRSAGGEGRFELENVRTSNDWGNALLSLKYERNFFNRFYSATTAGISTYETEFSKDDFVYSRMSGQSEERRSVTIFSYPFRNRSTMNEVRVNQNVEFRYSRIRAVLGKTWRYYQGEYSESSFDRAAFFSKTSAHLLDAYLHTEWKPASNVELETGSRFYYYSRSQQVFAGPRIKGRLTPVSWLRVLGGFSVNHQFLHRVSLQNATTADVWILSTKQQPPATSRQYSFGVEVTPFSAIYLKIEAYRKRYKKLRIHELNSQSLENTFSGTPWFYQNDGEARGVEVIIRKRHDLFTFTQSYTLSRMIFSNPFLLDGHEYYADWDRTHSSSSMMQMHFRDDFRLYVSWLMMSGASNALSTFGTDSEERLSPYYRMDVSLKYIHKFSRSSHMELGFSVFNVFDRDNVWYRNYDFSFDETRSIPRLQPIAVDVLDLGFHPSFNMKFHF